VIQLEHTRPGSKNAHEAMRSEHRGRHLDSPVGFRQGANGSRTENLLDKQKPIFVFLLLGCSGVCQATNTGMLPDTGTCIRVG